LLRRVDTDVPEVANQGEALGPIETDDTGLGAHDLVDENVDHKADERGAEKDDRQLPRQEDEQLVGEKGGGCLAAVPDLARHWYLADSVK